MGMVLFTDAKEQAPTTIPDVFLRNEAMAIAIQLECCQAYTCSYKVAFCRVKLLLLTVVSNLSYWAKHLPTFYLQSKYPIVAASHGWLLKPINFQWGPV
jgi:hypothetical protein